MIDNTIVIFSGCLLVLVVFIFHSLLRSKKILNRWADVFERNSIIAGINISMNKLSKEEALTAIAESVEEIGQPLRHYFSKSRDLKKFIDVPLGKEIVFDVLLDKDIRGIPDDLRNVLRITGAVIIKIESDMVDADKVTIFSRLIFLLRKRNKKFCGFTCNNGRRRDLFGLQPCQYLTRWNYQKNSSCGKATNAVLILEHTCASHYISFL